MIEEVILNNLTFNEEYTRKTLPFLKSDYFSQPSDKITFKLIERFFNNYNALPTREALLIELNGLKNLNQTQWDAAKEQIVNLSNNDKNDFDWLIKSTEEFCKEKAIYNALLEAVSIQSGESDKPKETIPEILKDALSVSFDSHIGHDFLENWSERFELYHSEEIRIPFDIELLNNITNGGLPNKTLTVLLAGTGAGKSRAMAHMAANNLREGRNVLYITAEMSDWRIAERIDANLLDININYLKDLTEHEYERKIENLSKRTKGKLVIKEYPTATSNVLHFKHLLRELSIKKNFVPDIIYIDYINICTSARIKMGGSIGSYGYIKSIAEEFRGLACEQNVPVITATQLNRDGLSSSDVGLENTSESMGLAHTADLMFALITTLELEEMNQQLVKQLKNRLGDPSVNRMFIIGIDNTKMRLYDVDQSAQEDLNNGPIIDNSRTGERINSEKIDKTLLDGFK